ncbi:RluA family pseudouridine synthase [bacterium]|nr:RluA family pseudouridine synthase [bacterium]
MNQGYRYIDTVDTDGEGETLLAFYTSRYTHSSEGEWRGRIEAGRVLVDGERVTIDEKLVRGQRLTYEREAWKEPDAPRTFDVLYEDEQIIAVDKPSGLPVLPGGHHLENTLLSAVRERFGGRVPPSPLHRLGRGTSGIVLFARNEPALRSLSEAFQQRSITKLYRALVQGTGLPETFTVDDPIGPVPYPPTGELFAVAEDGKPSTSECTVLSADLDEDETLIDVRLITGRSHQIRIHTAAAGHPLVGDPLYAVGGGPKPLVDGTRPPLPGDTGYFLHARLLKFTHPTSSEKVTVESTPPRRLQPHY